MLIFGSFYSNMTVVYFGPQDADPSPHPPPPVEELKYTTNLCQAALCADGCEPPPISEMLN